MTEPPIDVRGLDHYTQPTLAQLRPVSKMWKYLGRQFTADELYNAAVHDASDLRKLKFVRAYDVKPLRAAALTIASDGDLDSAILSLLIAKLPDIEWHLTDGWSKQFRKHLIVHGSILAPPDALTGQPMAMELFGRLVEIDSIQLDSSAGIEWKSIRHEQCHRAAVRNESIPGLVGAMTVVFIQATYANVKYPGVGVPPYF
jgi:hypothetical protein